MWVFLYFSSFFFVISSSGKNNTLATSPSTPNRDLVQKEGLHDSVEFKNLCIKKLRELQEIYEDVVVKFDAS